MGKIQITADNKDTFDGILNFYDGLPESSFKDYLVSAKPILVSDAYGKSFEGIEILYDQKSSSVELLPDNHTIKWIRLEDGNLFITCVIEGKPFMVVYIIKQLTGFRIGNTTFN